MRACTSLLSLSCCLGPLLFPLGLRGQAVTSTAADQKEVALTVYTQDLGLVREVREIALPAGRAELRFMDVAARIDPPTVHILPLGDPGALSVLEQNFAYDLLSPSKLLEKYVGQEVILEEVDPKTGERRSMTATILATNEGLVYRVGDQITFDAPGREGVPGRRVIFPRVPENLMARPTLVWLLEGRGEGRRRVEVSYLTAGISWEADYVAVLDKADARVDLSGWVTIDNKSGATYRDATLRLVAGDVHRVLPPALYGDGRLKGAEAMTMRPAFEEEAFFEYHLYTLDRTATVRDNEMKQLALLSAANVPIVKKFLLKGQRGTFLRRWEENPREKVGVYLEFTNSPKNALGIPLPKGVVRVYKAAGDGTLQFIGEDAIDHTPKDETLTIKMGEAFDVVAERKQTDYQRIGDRVTEEAYEIQLRSHKEEAITVIVEEPLPGDWTILSSSHPAEKVDAHRVRFSVPVPADGASTLTYRVRLEF